MAQYPDIYRLTSPRPPFWGRGGLLFSDLTDIMSHPRAMRLFMPLSVPSLLTCMAKSPSRKVLPDGPERAVSDGIESWATARSLGGQYSSSHQYRTRVCKCHEPRCNPWRREARCSLVWFPASTSREVPFSHQIFSKSDASFTSL